LNSGQSVAASRFTLAQTATGDKKVVSVNDLAAE
jgi:hypothetical protein